MNPWKNQPSAVLASGPSLTIEDIELIRRAGIKTVAVNTTWKKADFCDVIYGGDLAWWKNYGYEVNIPAERWTCSKTASKLYNLRHRERAIKSGYNSGLLAVELAAIHFGASPVIMLGFDCSVKHGVHHHGKHKKTGNPNAAQCGRWIKQWKQLMDLCLGKQVINCSRYTEIDCIPQLPLEQVLDSL